MLPFNVTLKCHPNLNYFKGITVESPPSEFNFDLSCNIALVLGQINKINPKNLAEEIKKVNFFKSLLTSLNYLIWGDV